ncbi:hypothetical protein LZ31DRAFT_203386 [Colletotrichum somersetense]|nr:hypothetical protein LZ31DRAFT_203386 [Colletotrichum somersetense]
MRGITPPPSRRNHAHPRQLHSCPSGLPSAESASVSWNGPAAKGHGEVDREAPALGHTRVRVMTLRFWECCRTTQAPNAVPPVTPAAIILALFLASDGGAAILTFSPQAT